MATSFLFLCFAANARAAALLEPPLAQRQQQTGRFAVFALGALHVAKPSGVADAARIDAAGDRALDAEVLAAGVVQAALGVGTGMPSCGTGDDGAGAALGYRFAALLAASARQIHPQQTRLRRRHVRAPVQHPQDRRLESRPLATVRRSNIWGHAVPHRWDRLLLTGLSSSNLCAIHSSMNVVDRMPHRDSMATRGR